MIEKAFHHEHFINRELSWLEFNARVLEEAEDISNPLLERAKFLAIFSSNLDEFFMVRVAGTREQVFGDHSAQDYAADGMSPIEQLKQIGQRTQELVAAQNRCWRESVCPALAEEGIRILKHHELSDAQYRMLDEFFQERAFPVLTPMAVDPSHPTPRFHNRGLYLAVTLDRTSGLGPKQLFAVVQLPPVLPRFVPIGTQGDTEFILLEDVIAARLPDLFGGFDVLNWSMFRITRDMDSELLDQEADDMLRLIERRIRERQRAQAIRLEVTADASPELVSMILREEELSQEMPELTEQPDMFSEVYYHDGLIDMTALFELVKLPGKEMLRDVKFTPCMPRGLSASGDLFRVISERDILLHHPYESFDPVVDLVQKAAVDPQVLAIKQTLYRTSGDSPIVKALMLAAENGKQVTALVELKARFDEANNVSWARQMEQAGVHVVFGFLDLKTHCKLLLIVRQEENKLKRYVHLGTGNYNPTTAKLYTDLGLFTSDGGIADDATALFNLLTGYSQGHAWNKLIVAPRHMQRRTIEMIEEQEQLAREGKPAWIFAKFNSLVDHRTMEALYRASQAGVPIDLVVRGICCLRPGLPGISENIRVRSIVDRFLEHSRIYVFGPQEEAKIYLSSADWMPRNFRRRVEVMFPIEAPDLRDRLLHEIIPTYLRDNTKARILQPNGTYLRLHPHEGEPAFRCQQELIDLATEEASEPLRVATTAHGSTAPKELTGAASDGNT